MVRRVVVVLATAAVLIVPGAAVAAQEEPMPPIDVPVEELIADGVHWDGRLVRVTGELIGDYGRRFDGFVWTQLNQDSYVYRPVVDGGALTGSNVGIGVRIPHDLAGDLDPPGGYRQRGPVVALSGIWRDHDPGRGGESYLDVTAVAVELPGLRLHEGPAWPVMVAGLVLLIAAGVAGAIGLRRSDGFGRGTRTGA